MTAAATPKGERRRATLVAAAGSLLIEGGFDKVSHRAVAERAKIALAATTYYFASLDELVASAATHAAAVDLAGVRSRASSLSKRRRAASATAEVLASVFFPATDYPDPMVISRYERMVISAREPRLQAQQRLARQEFAQLHNEILVKSGRTSSSDCIAQLMAFEDGAAVGALADDARRVHLAVRHMVAGVIDALAPPNLASAS